MRIISMSLEGYRQFVERTELDLPQTLAGICGPNGVGKSKLIEAIGYALYGPSAKILPRGDVAADIASRARAGTVPKVELTLEVRGEIYVIVREPGHAVIRMQGAADLLAETPTGVTKKVIELLRLPPTSYCGTFVARQREVAGLQLLQPKDRRQLVNRLIGISQVEEAIRLAQMELRGREGALREARASEGVDSREALAELERRREEHEAAKAGATASSQATRPVRSRYEAALSALSDLRGRRKQIAGLCEQLEGLAEDRRVWAANREAAAERMLIAVKAAEELRTARDALAETEAAPAELERQAAMAEIARLRNRQAEIGRDLEERLRPLSRKRAELITAIDEDNGAIEALEGELGAWIKDRASAEEAADRSCREAERYETRLRTAESLGAEGACEACGQVFGESLSHALAHYAQEAREFRRAEADALERARNAEIQEGIQRAKIAAITEIQCLRQKRLSEYETVPGEEGRAARDFREIADELAAAPMELLSTPYDPEAHRAAGEAVVRRNQAQLDVDRLAPLAAQEDEARAASAGAEAHLEQLGDRCRRLEEQITRLEVPPEQIEQVEGLVADAQSALEEAERAAREAEGRAAAAGARVQAAEAELERARRREVRIASAQRNKLVAERVGELLRRLLTEIISEARPRLVELMDGWARALLGPRLRGIDLTDDYRIKADTGSGWHKIEHFSGGEQTLLALMLRVGISLFCHERAGFDRGFLILDEVFGDQDAERRAQLVQFLSEIKEHYHQILVVNHVDDVTDMLDSIIEVVPTGPNSSTARVRS